MRAQVEMIGLVFVVLILVIGIVLYARFSVVPEQEPPETTSAFLTALKETTVDSCNANVERVARACLEGTPFCVTGDPCTELQDTFDEVGGVLDRQGIVYNLSLEQTSVMTGDCPSSNPTVGLSSAPVSEIVLSGGVSKGRIRLSVCR